MMETSDTTSRQIRQNINGIFVPEIYQCPNLYTGRFQLENKLNTIVSENGRFHKEINADQRHGSF
jgi:hypothetical protein